VGAKYKDRALGGLGDLDTFSFRETKNIISGEGGCPLVNNPALISRAEIIRGKGTDRGRFFRGEVDKYTWQENGSSFLPGEADEAGSLPNLHLGALRLRETLVFRSRQQCI
jgi:dTDP-4-amino-4,6-dideoxygalactose transaminase